MDIKQLKYFLAIAKEKQITAAAKKLHIAQPPLSTQLRLLEEELGTSLLERGSRNITLTDAGKILFTRANEIINLVESTKKEIDDLNHGLNGTLNIGAVTSSISSIIPEQLKLFHSQYKRVNFQIWDGDTLRITELLRNNTIEIGIVKTPFDYENYDFILIPSKISTTPMLAITNSLLSSNKLSIDVKALADKPLIVHRRYEKKITVYCEEHGFKPSIFCKADDIRLMLALAYDNIGVAILPKSNLDSLSIEKLRPLEINGLYMDTSFAVIWPKNHYLSNTAKRFIESFTQKNPEEI
ncbi:LysR family transcriptional regulator [Clostridium neuense]|uniref:LysR family transcriptional regulator n=1 Tax=Clostridium neuense TaxID=1728934 RepID=A0ABW8TDB1_9CLOT